MSTPKLPAKGRRQFADGSADGQDGTIELQSASKELDQLHEWQSSPAGMIAGHVADLVSTSMELKRLSRDPVSFRLIATEVSDLELVETEISQLISRMQRTKGAAE
jgi:hypothetical protein